MRAVKSRKITLFEQLCKHEGVPLTVQRRVILEALISRTDHPTADQIFQQVKTQIPGVSRTTVYRVLETLVRWSVVRKVSHPGASARFEANTEPHHHLICSRCERLTDIVHPALAGLPIPTTVEGFQITDYTVNVVGLCSGCRRVKTPGVGRIRARPRSRPRSARRPTSQSSNVESPETQTKRPRQTTPRRRNGGR